MSSSTSSTAGDSSRIGHRVQRYWDTAMVNAFSCEEPGAGTFLVSMRYGLSR